MDVSITNISGAMDINVVKAEQIPTHKECLWCFLGYLYAYTQCIDVYVSVTWSFYHKYFKSN